MRRRLGHRKGNIVVLSAFLMVVLVGLLAFALDVGYIYVARSQLQRTADAAAMAGAWELLDADAVSGSASESLSTNARSQAGHYASLNGVLTSAPALAEQDVTVGYIANPLVPGWTLQTAGVNSLNAVRVSVRRHEDQNGEVPLFFARVLGQDRVALQADATAALIVNIGGFQTPGGDGNDNIGILPYALDEDTWTNMLAGGGSDDWTWDGDEKEIGVGPDGVREVNLFPQGTGSPGNRGTVDIGSSNNSTADIARQILQGVSKDDLDHHGGKLELDETGQLQLNGDTGISAGVKDELTSIKGQPRIIPIFRTVVGPGNNATYTIIAFVGIRIMDVKLTGKMNQKRVVIQPANVVTRGAIPAGDETRTSYFVYSPVWLVK
jgi:hypothetical protein